MFFFFEQTKKKNEINKLNNISNEELILNMK